MSLLKKIAFPLTLVAVLLLSLLTFVVPEKVSAAAPANASVIQNGSYRFVHRGLIVGTIDGTDYNFVDQDPTDNTNEYVIDSTQSPCYGRISFGDGDTITPQGGQGGSPTVGGRVDIDIANTAATGADCLDIDEFNNVRIDASNIGIWFNWVNRDAIVLVKDQDSPQSTFIREAEGSTVFVQQGVSSCADKLLLAGPGGVRIYRMDADGDGWDDVSEADVNLLQPGTCRLDEDDGRDVGGQQDPPPNNGLYAVGNIQNTNVDPADSPAPGADPNAPDPAADESCESQSGALGWILCPVILTMDSAFNWLDSQIQALLAINDDKYNNAQLYGAWANIRNIAYAILIPIMLVMVIGTAVGIEAFSAYTVKKALPRMVAAIIIITLSWYITGFMIGFFNVVGAGVMGLITAPFNETMTIAGKTVSTLSLADIFSASGSTFTETMIAQIGTTIGVVILLALFLPSIVMTMLIAFGALLFRQILIIALMLLAPLAILAWIFPGNDRMWKLWWWTFTKLLMTFPIIMAVLAVGRIFSLIIMSDSEVTNTVMRPLMAVIAYVLPYAFIPFTFRLAGGFFATITGMANDRSKGFFDNQKKKRAEKIHRAGMNEYFNPNGRLGRFNSAIGWAADPRNNARIALGTRGGRSLAASLTAQSAQQSGDLAKWMSMQGFNQEALSAIMQNVKKNHGHLNMKELESTANEYLTARNADGSFKYDTQYRAAASQLMDNGAFLSDLYKNEDFQRANVGMAAGYAKAQQGFINSGDPNELAEYSNFLNTVAPGLGNTFKTQAGLMNAQGGGLTKVGYSEQVDARGNIIAGGKAARAIQMSRESVQTWSGSKASQLARHFVGRAQDGEAAYTSSALDMVLNTADGDTIRDDVSGEKLEVTNARKQTLLDTMAQAAYGYNTPAETAEVLQNKLNHLIGDVQTVDVRDADGKVTGRRTVRADGSELSDVQKMAMSAKARAYRDPSQFGGLDRQPDPEE